MNGKWSWDINTIKPESTTRPVVEYKLNLKFERQLSLESRTLNKVRNFKDWIQRPRIVTIRDHSCVHRSFGTEHSQ